MKILITGGTTFVSRYAAEHFVSKGEEVFVLNRNSRPHSQGVHLINCDRLNLGNKFANEHFDLILDITAYTDEHIKALLNSGVSFDENIIPCTPFYLVFVSNIHPYFNFSFTRSSRLA